MSRDGSVTLEWADGEYTFALKWGELSALQEACDAGPFVILDRLTSGKWLLTDISATIRFGLIGGGCDPAKALRLVKTYVEGRPPAENVSFATGILASAVMGSPEETPGEHPAAPEKAGD